MSRRIPFTLREWWFGAVPETWRQVPLKHLCDRYSLYGANIPAEMYESDGVRFLRTTDIGEDGTLGADGVFIPRELVAESILAEGDFLISRSGTVGRAFVYRETDGPCSYAGYLVRYVLNDKRSARWLFYVTKSAPFVVWLGASAIEATIGNVNGEKYANLVLPVPPLERQLAIADFLDRETSRLDALVAAKQRLIDLLAEKRKALIATAVTRGLDKKVKLRDSRVPWLGEIPAHWEIERARWLFRERDVRGEPALPLMEVSISNGVSVREYSDERIETTAADFNTYKVARGNDIAFNKMRMWQGAVGVSPTDGLVSPDYVVAEPTGSMLPDYAGLLFRIEALSAECGRRSHGLTWDRLRIYWEEFREILLPLPPAAEQQAIVAHLTRETAKLDAVRAATERTIALLKERRAALIAAAVTGHLDVEAAA